MSGWKNVLNLVAVAGLLAGSAATTRAQENGAVSGVVYENKGDDRAGRSFMLTYRFGVAR